MPNLCCFENCRKRAYFGEDKKYVVCKEHNVNNWTDVISSKCFCGKAVQTFAGNASAKTLCNWHSFENRYWENVNKKTINECWEWIGSKTSAGYGIIFFNVE